MSETKTPSRRLRSVPTEEIEAAVAASKSFAEVARILGTYARGNSTQVLSRRVEALGISTAHFHSQRERNMVSATFATIFRNITDDQIIAATPHVTSFTALMAACGVSPKKINGLNFRDFRKRVVALGVDISHFIRPSGLSKGETRYYDPDYFLNLQRPWRSRGAAKRALLGAGLIRYECYECGQGPDWRGQKLPLALVHIDRDDSNNALENLEILCPNCYSVKHARKNGGKAVAAREERRRARNDHAFYAATIATLKR